MTETGKQYKKINRKTIGNARRLRRDMTPAERTLWRVLRNRNLEGYKFRRQHPIEKYIVDFYCAEASLVIEIDGDIHSNPEKSKQDKIRSEYLEGKGYRVLRYTNEEVLERLEDVVEMLIEVVCELS